MSIRPGRIQASDLGRKFELSTGGRSLKATLLRRESKAIHEFWALRHVSVEIEPGETFGIVGRNGSGKSTFMKMLARIYGPSEGSCRVEGRMSSLIELGAGFHGEFNAVENIFLSGAVYGIPKREIERDLDAIIAFAELEKFAYQPIKTYSSGMFMRLGFSVAMHVRPDVLLLDEVLAVGDEKFIQKCLGRIAQFRRDGGTMLLVTHDPGTVKRLCSRAMLLERGEVVTIDSAEAVIDEYHKRLATTEDVGDPSEPHRVKERHFDIDTRVLNAQGEQHSQFLEGEPFTIQLHLTPHAHFQSCDVGVGICDELGREIGGQVMNGITFAAEKTTVIDLALSHPPLRNGLFQVNVGVSDPDTGTNLLDAVAIESISVYGRKPESYGPVQLDGAWNVR